MEAGKIYVQAKFISQNPQGWSNKIWLDSTNTWETSMVMSWRRTHWCTKCAIAVTKGTFLHTSNSNIKWWSRNWTIRKPKTSSAPLTYLNVATKRFEVKWIDVGLRCVNEWRGCGTHWRRHWRRMHITSRWIGNWYLWCSYIHCCAGNWNCTTTLRP